MLASVATVWAPASAADDATVVSERVRRPVSICFAVSGPLMAAGFDFSYQLTDRWGLGLQGVVGPMAVEGQLRARRFLFSDEESGSYVGLTLHRIYGSELFYEIPSPVTGGTVAVGYEHRASTGMLVAIDLGLGHVVPRLGDLPVYPTANLRVGGAW